MMDLTPFKICFVFVTKYEEGTFGYIYVIG